MWCGESAELTQDLARISRITSIDMGSGSEEAPEGVGRSLKPLAALLAPQGPGGNTELAASKSVPVASRTRTTKISAEVGEIRVPKYGGPEAKAIAATEQAMQSGETFLSCLNKHVFGTASKSASRTPKKNEQVDVDLKAEKHTSRQARASTMIPPGYMNLEEGIKSWKDPLEIQIENARKCQMVPGANLKDTRCGLPPSMGVLSVSSISTIDGHSVFNVSGTWLGKNCALAVRLFSIGCPTDYTDHKLFECQKCTRHGYLKMSVASQLITKSGCDEWFARTDQVTRASVSIMRVSSLLYRMNNCQGTLAAGELGFRTCKLQNGKRCPMDKTRTHKLDKATVAQCAASCASNADCKYFTSHVDPNKSMMQGWCIGCTEPPSLDADKDASITARTYGPNSTSLCTEE